MSGFTRAEEADKAFIAQKLKEYNFSCVPAERDTPPLDISRKIAGGDGVIRGGIIGRVNAWNILCIDILWVDESLRGRGVGKALLKAAEDAAREAGAYLSQLDTFDFQARDFYQKYGYELFGTLEDSPRGHCHYYLKKYLRENTCGLE